MYLVGLYHGVNAFISVAHSVVLGVKHAPTVQFQLFIAYFALAYILRSYLIHLLKYFIVF